jgi:hypothetical protein
MNVLGFNTDAVTSQAGNWLYMFLYGIGILLIVGVFGYLIFNYYRNKSVYVTPVRLIRRLENGTKKEINGLKGGKVQKEGIQTFAVKIPRKFKKHFLGYVPDYSKSDADGRLTFLTIGDGTLWQQCEERLQTEEVFETILTKEESDRARDLINQEVEKRYPTETEERKNIITEESFKRWLETNGKYTTKYSLVMKPISTDVKTVTINNMQGWRQILEKNKVSVMMIAFGSFIIMAIAHLISLYVQTKVKCSVPTP